MPRIDENKIADILNTLLTESILKGENLIQQMNQSVNVLNKNVDSLTNTLSARTSEIQELVKALKNTPKISKTLKLSSLAASFVAGAAFAALIYAYPLSSITHKFIQAEVDVKEFSTKYTELEKYAIALRHENIAYKRTLDKTLTQNGVEKFREIYMEELEKIKEESK